MIKEFNMLPQCITCKHFHVDKQDICVPTTNGHPCLVAHCSNIGLYENAYGFDDKPLSLWVDLVSHVAWIDGSYTIPQECKGYIKSPSCEG